MPIHLAIYSVKADMDAGTALLGAHGYCTQVLTVLVCLSAQLMLIDKKKKKKLHKNNVNSPGSIYCLLVSVKLVSLHS